MPETIDKERALRNSEMNSRLVRETETRRHEHMIARDFYIRESVELGATFHELSKATGLSRAQVQRICDYSKDKPEHSHGLASWSHHHDQGDNYHDHPSDYSKDGEQ